MAEERVQRRLAAILAADVVGYSRLIEANEAGTRARLRSLHSEPAQGSPFRVSPRIPEIAPIDRIAAWSQLSGRTKGRRPT